MGPVWVLQGPVGRAVCTYRGADPEVEMTLDLAVNMFLIGAILALLAAFGREAIQRKLRQRVRDAMPKDKD